MARNYVSTGSPEYLQRYQNVLDIREGRKPRATKYVASILNVDSTPASAQPNAAIPLLELMRRAGITPQEFELLAQAKSSSDTLALTEFAAMNMVEKGSGTPAALAKARTMMYDQEYQAAKAGIMVAIDSFYTAVDERTTTELRSVNRQTQIIRGILIALGLGLITVLYRAHRVLSRALGGAVETVHHNITQLGQGNFSQVIPVTPGDTDSVLARLAQAQAKLRSIHEAQQQSDDAREKAVREASTLMHAIDEHAIVSMTDASGTITYANEMFSRVSGYTNEELIGSNHRIVKSSMQDDAYWVKMWRTISNGHVWRDVICNRAKNGSLYWVDTVIAPFTTERGVDRYISIRTDLTAIKQAQKALESERTRLANLIVGTRVGTWEINLDNGEVVVNSRWAEMYGFTLDEIQPRPGAMWLERIHPDDLAHVREALRKHCHGETETLEFEARIRHKNGHWVWQQGRGKLISRLADGHPEWLYGIDLDVTEQKETEEKLKATAKTLADNTAFLSRAGRVAGLGRWQLDLDNWALEWSEQTCHIMDVAPGYHPTFEQMIGFVAPESRDMMRSVFAVASETGKPWDVEIQLVTAMGRRIWVRSAAEAEYSVGRRTRLVGIFQDISQRRKLEDDVRRRNELMRSILDHIPVGLSVVDAKFNLVERNELFRTLLDLPQSLLNRDSVSFESIIRFNALRGEYGDSDPDATVKRILNQARFAQPHQFQRARGDGRTIEVRGAPMPDGGFVTTYADITDLKNAMDAAQAASRSKSQFVANMSHEIRTPMNAILGLLRLLQQTELSSRQLDYVTKTEGAAKSLLGLLNDILDFSKMEAGKMELDPHPFQLDRVLRELSVILSANAGGKFLEILFDVDPKIPGELIGDSMRLHQVLINLAGNAIKFTAHGEVVIGIELLSLTNQVANLKFSVKDTGIGIAADKLSQVFEDFSQAEGTTTRKYGGTGLGLSISRKLVDLMGGQLQVASAPGVGSTFYFTIPMVLVPTATVPAVNGQAEVPPQLRVLVVDDNAVARELLVSMALQCGWSTDAASSGEHAVKLVNERVSMPNTNSEQLPFDLVLMDWHMPGGMDGWESLRALKQFWPKGKGPLIVMVTSHGREDLSLRSPVEQASLDGFLVKPVTASMLHEIVRNARSGHRNLRTRHRGEDAKDKRLRGMRLLVVEDNLINQQVAKELLVSEGAIVELAENGITGVAAIREHHGTSAFDAVLMDLQMPEMDGFAATNIIRREMGLNSLPVIAMTANAMASDKEACLAAGMNDHVGKPFDLNHLVQVLLTQTQRVQRTTTTTPVGALEAPLGKVLAVPPLEDGAEPNTTATALDMEAALNRLGNNVDLYLSIVQDYLSEAAQTADQLDRLLAQDDLPAAARLLHTIKGLSGTVGAVGMAAIAKAAEAKVKGSAVFSAVDLRRDFRSAVELTIAALERASLELVKRTTADSAPLQSAGPGPSTLERLHVLRALLAESDLQALEVHAELLSTLRTPSSLMDGLNQAIAKFDFDLATKQCDALIAMEAKPESPPLAAAN
jgi:PAS domain S-box-containing protein